MSSNIETAPITSLEDVFMARKQAKREMDIAQTALLGVLRLHKDNYTPVRVVGIPSRVAMARFDEDGDIVSRVAVHMGQRPFAKRPRVARTIERGFIADVRQELTATIVSVQPDGLDDWYQFGLNSIVEINTIEPSNRLRTQRAIIGAETTWGIGVGDPSNQFNREL